MTWQFGPHLWTAVGSIVSAICTFVSLINCEGANFLRWCQFRASRSATGIVCWKRQDAMDIVAQVAQTYGKELDLDTQDWPLFMSSGYLVIKCLMRYLHVGV